MSKLGVSTPQILWRVARVLLLLASIGFIVRTVSAAAPITTKSVYTGDEIMQVHNYADSLALVLLVLMFVVFVQVSLAVYYRVTMPNLKNSKEKNYVKNVLSFEVPFIAVFHVIALGVTLYATYALRSWPLVSPAQPRPFIFILTYLLLLIIPLAGGVIYKRLQA